MRSEEIVNLTKYIKNKFKTNDPNTIISKLSRIEIGKTSINPRVFKAQAINYEHYISILLNENYQGISRKFLLAHELGHAILHKELINYMGSIPKSKQELTNEYEANLFAVSLLLDESKLNVNFSDLTAYELSCIMDMNITIKECC